MEKHVKQQVSPEETKTLRSQLQERLSVLVEEFRRELEKQTDEKSAELYSQVHDIGDEAVADVLMDSRLFDIQRDANEIRDIREALIRMNDGSYGECVDCGEPIAADRLHAEPAAKRCLLCQTRYERNQGTTNPREI